MQGVRLSHRRKNGPLQPRSASRIALWPQCVYNRSADVARDGLLGALSPALSQTSLTEAGVRRCWRAPYYLGQGYPI